MSNQATEVTPAPAAGVEMSESELRVALAKAKNYRVEEIEDSGLWKIVMPDGINRSAFTSEAAAWCDVPNWPGDDAAACALMDDLGDDFCALRHNEFDRGGEELLWAVDFFDKDVPTPNLCETEPFEIAATPFAPPTWNARPACA